MYNRQEKKSSLSENGTIPEPTFGIGEWSPGQGPRFEGPCGARSAEGPRAHRQTETRSSPRLNYYSLLFAANFTTTDVAQFS